VNTHVIALLGDDGHASKLFNRKEHKKSDGLPQCLQPGLAMSSLGTNTIGKL